MLRAESVTYSSVPQDEGTTHGSTFTTSRSPYDPHNRRDCQLTAIITTIVIITGLTLAATLPLIIKRSTTSEKPTSGSPDRLSGDDDDDGFLNSHLNEGKDGDFTVKMPNYNFDSYEDYDFEFPPNTKPPVVVPVQTTKRPTPPPEPVTTTVKNPVPVGAFVTTATSNQSFQESANSVNGNIPPTVGKVFTSVGVGLVPTQGGNSAIDESQLAQGGSNLDTDLNQNKPTTESVINPDNSAVKEEGSATSNTNTQTEVPHEKDDNIDLEQLLNEIYGEEGSSKPGSVDNSSWMSDVLSTKDKLTLVILAAVVAVALAAVVAAVVWLIHSRVTARRRRINIQNVITDLQSRDKIVLLNSEDSEEE